MDQTCDLGREVFPPKSCHFSIPALGDTVQSAALCCYHVDFTRPRQPLRAGFFIRRLPIKFYQIGNFSRILGKSFPSGVVIFCLRDRHRFQQSLGNLPNFVEDNGENVRKGGRPWFAVGSQLQEIACRVSHVHPGLCAHC
jgi:hypothetical protein